MLDWETFLTALYVMADDFCHSRPTPPPRPGRAPKLTTPELLTLTLFARFRRFAGERDFYRWATVHLGSAFPQLPDRSQYNRQVRRHQSLLEAFALHLAQRLEASHSPFEALDRVAVPVRDARRRGRGWLPGIADYGFQNPIGWYFGFAVLVSTHPEGVITGWGFGSARTKDQRLAETFLAARQRVGRGELPCSSDPERPGAPSVCLESVGAPAERVYLADKGFQGPTTHRAWREQYGAEVIAPPQDHRAKHPWPRGLRRVLSGMRQIVETVIEKLEGIFALANERPHTLGGFAARLAARVGLHNFCYWLNRQAGRPGLAFVDLVVW